VIPRVHERRDGGVVASLRDREETPDPYFQMTVVARPLAAIVGRLAVMRRRYYESDPVLRRRLAQPVVSIGNLSVGGSGKTPIVAHVTALLVESGERPAILTRGYGRTDEQPGVVVVSDGRDLHADLGRAGDEPLMLARALPGASVFVARDRAWAGALAERRFGATVHVLDDGLQHLGLSRDIELVVARPDDEADRLMPSGRLREPIETLSHADALLVPNVSLAEARAMAARWHVPKAFTVTRAPAVPRLVEPWGAAPRVPRSAPVVALAGIARPARFFDDVARAGWTIVDRLSYPDHHAFSARDVARVASRARETRAALVLTTEKDVMRLLQWRPLPVPVAWVPLSVSVEPDEDFRLWLRWRLQQARRVTSYE
jgi:tetraacyldisaccharide 4'-kinase